MRLFFISLLLITAGVPAVSFAADTCSSDDEGYQSPFDWDGDGWCDSAEQCDNDRGADLCPKDYDTNNTDMDGDGIGDVCDTCPLVASPVQGDLDRDGVGDECDADQDGDLTLDKSDNCPSALNPDQSDMDDDGEGNACDSDIDGDAAANEADVCPFDSAVQVDDGLIDPTEVSCTGDSDGDGVNDFVAEGAEVLSLDNCPFVVNPEQGDIDGDLIGNFCDPDVDGDGVIDSLDNCNFWVLRSRVDEYNTSHEDDPDYDAVDLSEWTVEMWLASLDNPEQLDVDKDRVGDICDFDFSKPTDDGTWENEQCYVVLGDVENCLDVTTEALEVYTPTVIAAYTNHDPVRLRLFANREQARIKYRWLLVSGNVDGIELENVAGFVDCSTSYEYHYAIKEQIPPGGKPEDATLQDTSAAFVVLLSGKYIVRLQATLVDDAGQPLPGDGVYAEAEVVINATGEDEYVDEGCECATIGASSRRTSPTVWIFFALSALFFSVRRFWQIN